MVIARRKNPNQHVNYHRHKHSTQTTAPIRLVRWLVRRLGWRLVRAIGTRIAQFAVQTTQFLERLLFFVRARSPSAHASSPSVIRYRTAYCASIPRVDCKYSRHSITSRDASALHSKHPTPAGADDSHRTSQSFESLLRVSHLARLSSSVCFHAKEPLVAVSALRDCVCAAFVAGALSRACFWLSGDGLLP